MIPVDAHCHNCQWWTHESGAIDNLSWERGYAVCGKKHDVMLYGEGVHVNIVTHRDMEGCLAWERDVPVPVVTDEEVGTMVSTWVPIETEADDIADEDWNVLRGVL